MDHARIAERFRRSAGYERLATLHPRPKLQNPYVAPESALEQAIAAIWQRALGIAQIGVQDHFFELGGDLLVAIQVTQALKRELNITIPVVNLYEALTICAMLACWRPRSPASRRAGRRMAICAKRRCCAGKVSAAAARREQRAAALVARRFMSGAV